MAEDNWQHRSAKMKCSTCMWFVVKQSAAAAVAAVNVAQPPTADLGRCRRYAPTMNGWPAVFSTDWCGNHKLDENKI